MNKPKVAGPVITEKGPTDFGGLIGDPVSADAPTEQEPIVTPPPIPTVDRETGAVDTARMEDVGQLDGWINGETPDETFDLGPDFCRPNQRNRGRKFPDLLP